MIFGILTLFTALSMATVAAVFAIYGIIAIFAGMPQFALVMGAVIELGKVVGISWLYRNWNEPTKIKYAMTPLVLVAMLLTSLGIFGLLSKAHLDQTSPVANNQIRIERLDQQISREQSRISDGTQVISQLDQSVQALINFDRIRGPDGAIAARESQADQRDLLRQTIDTAQAEVDLLEDQKLELSQQLRTIQLEVGPVKYLAELVYGDGSDRTEEAIRWVIIAFIFVFDPMAILLLMAANYTLSTRKEKLLATQNELAESSNVIKEKDSKVEEIENDDTTSNTSTTSVSDHSDTNANIDSSTSTTEKTTDLQESPSTTDNSGIIPIQSEGTIDTIKDTPDKLLDVEELPPSVDIDIIEPTAIEPVIVQLKSIAEKKIDVRIETEGVTPVHDIGNGYVEYNNHLFQKDALKELRPDLFSLKIDQHNDYKSGFGTQFPKVAKKKDIFVRVDMMPNRVFRFDGTKWIGVNKDLTESYLYDQEYIRYLISKIDSKEYDIELLSEQEKNQIEEYLNNQI